MRKRGFTLIELIVVMAIIAILVLLGTPKYREYTNEARITRMKVNIKELENANLQYYMNHEEWARVGEVPYTSEEIATYANEVYDKTGLEVNLDVDGKYYDIDYTKLNSFITNIDNKELYLLQNPVGNVYKVDSLTELGKEHFVVEESDKDSGGEDSGEVLFTGLDSTAFDENSETSVGIIGSDNYVTWSGNLTGKQVDITCKAHMFSNGTTTTLKIQVLDVNNNVLLSNSVSYLKTTLSFIIPENAVKLQFINSSITALATIYDIHISDTVVEPIISSIALTQPQQLGYFLGDELNLDGAIITAKYTNNLIEIVQISESMLSNFDMNIAGKQIISVTYKGLSKTFEIIITEPVIFTGLGSTIYDGNYNTTASVLGSNNYVTWSDDLTGKQVDITCKAHMFPNGTTTNLKIQLLDVNNTILVTKTASASMTKLSFIIPEGAVKFQFIHSSSTASANIYEMRVSSII